MTWLQEVGRKLKLDWPEELPPMEKSGTRAFWKAACRQEYINRRGLSAKIQALTPSQDFSDLTPIESWLFRRRMEWAIQIADAACRSTKSEALTLEWLIAFTLVESWESEGRESLLMRMELQHSRHAGAPDWAVGTR